tara:strand:+ start:259 stop:534 length:276 start_codon:yes stop_codon:yes gene_type:complete
MINTILYFDAIKKNNKLIKKYQLLDQNGYLDNILTKTYKIKFDDIYYFGVFQGQKIYINGKKYPKKHSCFYTSNNLNKNIVKALNEKNGVK